ncbi:MAG: T9SS type A sorting domain-containing protein [Saprospirales bacterium]|nr:T9SS type A sorting domain-containing protein [Saprospirales bacterium]
MRKPNTCLLTLFLGLGLHTIYSQTLQQLPTNYLEPGDLFGVSVDINANATYIVVGAPFHRNFDDALDQQEGVAFVYTLSGNAWVLQDTLDNPALGDLAALGAAVSINTNGDRIAVGSPGASNQRGDARVFKRIGSSWSMLPALHHMGNSGDNTSASPGDGFGAVLTLDGSGYYMAVGSPAHHHSTGRANVCFYDVAQNSWKNYESLENPAPDKGDFFGASMAIDLTGNFLVIGAPGEDNGIGGNDNTIDNYGAVYYYQRNPMTQNTWYYVEKIKLPNLQPQSQFGFSVDLNKTGDSLIVGAPGHDGKGAAFVYKKVGNTWIETDMITAHNPVAEDKFGFSVAMSGVGDIALVGAPLRDTASVTDIGSTFLFSYVNPTVEWVQQKNLSLPPGYEAGEAFGSSVSLAHNLFKGVIGSPFRKLLRGAVFVINETALPVTWLSFRATVVDDDVLLTWSTASESNNEAFIVERSPNGVDFKEIAQIPGAGNTSEVQNYLYTDPSPCQLHTANCTLYYRLQQRDYDGTTDYSPIRVVQLQAKGDLRVYPNPASEVATISFAEPTEVRGTLQLLTGNGRLLVEHVIPIHTTAYEVRVATVPPGTYMLKVKVGVKEWTKRLVVE